MTAPFMRALIVGTAVSLLACSRPDDQRTDTIDRETVEQARAAWPDGVAMRIDSGNAAYRSRDYEAAAALYRRAAELGPDIPAAWFGIYMVEHARGNLAAADSALARARQLAPGASLIAPPRDTTSPH